MPDWHRTILWYIFVDRRSGCVGFLSVSLIILHATLILYFFNLEAINLKLLLI